MGSWRWLVLDAIVLALSTGIAEGYWSGGSGSESNSGWGSGSGSGSGSGGSGFDVAPVPAAPAPPQNDGHDHEPSHHHHEEPAPSPSNEPQGGGLKAQSVEKQKIPAKKKKVWDTASCGRSSVFSGFVFVEHALLDNVNIDDKTLDILETSFLDTYNSLNSPKILENVCDEVSMRLVDKVEVTVMVNTYKPIDGQKLEKRNFLYNITGYGIGTTEDTPVFDHHGIERGSASAPDDMDDYGPCSCSPFLSEQRGPTEEEFKDAFKASVKSLSKSGALQNVEDVYKVIEYDAVDCDGWDNDFYTEVDLEFSLDPTRSDYGVLQDSFQNSYNHLTVNNCDPNFRHVQDVTVEDHTNEGDGDRKRTRGLKGEKVPTKKKKKKKRKLKFKVKGRCKGCKKKSKIFDDAQDGDNSTSTRLLETVTEEEKEDRLLEEYFPGADEASEQRRALHHWFDWHHMFGDNREVCFCSAHPRAMRAPTQEEFTKRYNNTLQNVFFTTTGIDFQVKQLTEIAEAVPTWRGTGWWQ